jgi:hypothetical protein
MKRIAVWLWGALVLAACSAAAAPIVKSTDSSPPATDSSPPTDGGASMPSALTPASEVSANVEFGPLPDLAAVSTDGRVTVVRGGEAGVPVKGIVSSDERNLIETSTVDGVTSVVWNNLRTGEEWARASIDGALTAIATDPSGRVVALTSDDPTGSAGTEIVVATADQGEAFRHSYGSELLPEGFANFNLAGSRVPAGLFVIEYLDPRSDNADAPRRYRVRVVDTATGELQLPLNLRDKTQTVDEEMLGFSRTHVTSQRDGLLFTLYRGLEDDESQYAFVHTLGFVNGVYCLDLPPELWLERLPGAVVLTDDQRRLLVTSANGYVTEFVVDHILDPNQNPAPERTVQAWSEGPQAAAPSVSVGADSLLVGQGSRLRWLDPSTFAVRAQQDWDMDIEAVAVLPDGDAIAAGTRRISQITPDGQLAAEAPLPEGFGRVAAVIVIGD